MRVAVDAVPAGGVRVSARAGDATRALAKGRPVAAAATADLCGAGYELTFAEQYAGPARVNDVCGEVAAIMKSGNAAIIDRIRPVPPCT
ncbi:hypothetical protein ACGFZK_16605 [Streptomyces sp. NPDC048257]|uniref:hypothetical protein n=1 Tax=Streptomyces sp. NPDC048257 TaxID=3365526 RepID=UPI003722B653